MTPKPVSGSPVQSAPAPSPAPTPAPAAVGGRLPSAGTSPGSGGRGGGGGVRSGSLKDGWRRGAVPDHAKQLAASLMSSDVSPEATLVDFISTSAAYFGVHKRSFNNLEREILQVGPNNIMPANAAAWYLAKKRHYQFNPPQFQLLPYVLKKYTDKFLVKGNYVEFLESCDKDVACRKLRDLTQLGLLAYFSHKVEEYGVYMFDPRYYETVEPFRAGLQAMNGRRNEAKDSLIEAFFKKVGRLQLQSVNPYIMALAPKNYPLEVRDNVVGVVTEKIDEDHGLLKFGTGDGTAKAIFSVKSLFKDRLPFKGGDILTLPVLTFDGYRLPQRMRAESGQEYSWAAVLVWSGTKPSPKYNSTKADLLGHKTAPRVVNTFDELVGKLGNFSMQPGQPIRSNMLPGDAVTTNTMPYHLYPPQSNECMQVGEVREILAQGALISLGNDKDGEKAFVYGVRSKKKKYPAQLKTANDVIIEVGDLVGYYLDKHMTAPRELGAIAVGFGNVVKLRGVRDQKKGKQNAKATDSGENSSTDKAKRGRKSKSSESDKNADKQAKLKKPRPRTKSSASVSSNKDTAEGKKATAIKRTRASSENYVKFLLEDPSDKDSVNSDVDPPFHAIVPCDEYAEFDEYSDGEITEKETDLLKTDLDDVDPVKLKEEIIKQAKELKEKREALEKLAGLEKDAAPEPTEDSAPKTDGLSAEEAEAAAQKLGKDSAQVTVQGDVSSEDTAAKAIK